MAKRRNFKTKSEIDGELKVKEGTFVTIAEKNRIMWPEPVEEQMNPEQIALWVEKNLDLSMVDYVEFSGGRTHVFWETGRNDDFMAPSEASYARLLEKVKSY